MSANDFLKLSTLSDTVDRDNDPLITGLTADSRKVQKGWLFAALPGAHTDGRRFIEQAVERGAVAILGPEGGRPESLNVPYIADSNPRQRLARMAARFYRRQPDTLVAVTGTNGKTSVVTFTRQIWETLGYSAAAVGTLGVRGNGIKQSGSLTTPDTISLHETLNDLATRGIGHVAFEASSHGLDQFRLDGLCLAAGAFTNLTRDHLDYHQTMEAYATAKARLFSDILPSGATAVINSEDPFGVHLIDIARRRGLRTISYGLSRQGELRAQVIEKSARGQRVMVRINLDETNETADFFLPLVGAFQLSNVLCALGLVLAGGAAPVAALEALASLTGVPGRLQLVGQRSPDNNAPVYVDYAHTPDALKTALTSLRPHTANRLIVVFGCGGDRDPGKRPQMGKIATDFADMAIVSDDNPRSEAPAAIRAAIMKACPGGIEIDGRAKAIAFGTAALRQGDILLIAGKGHETTQTIGDRVFHFDDAEEAVKAIATLDTSAPPLWTSGETAEATGGTLLGPAWKATGISSNSTTIKAGDLFIALRGDRMNGNDFAAEALQNGAAAALVDTLQGKNTVENAPLLLVDDTMQALKAMANVARQRMNGTVIAVTGSVGKTGTKDMIALMLSHHGRTHATPGNLNNHWGVPLSLVAMPGDSAFGVFEAGMNHAGELTPLSQLIRPDIALITAVEAAHLGHFTSIEEIAGAKAEIFSGLKSGGYAILNRDSPHFDRLSAPARERGATILGFGLHPEAEASLVAWEPCGWKSHVSARILGHEVRYTLGVPGRHWVINSLGALLAVAISGVDLSWAMRALALFAPPYGRGKRHTLALREGTAVLIDESYNASPASVQAAFNVLSTALVSGSDRKIAVLGDMLELGEQSASLHAALAETAVAAHIDTVHTAGSLMKNLHDALPVSMRGIHTADADAMAKQLSSLLQPNDIILVKGSASSRMNTVVQALLRHFSNASQPSG